MITIEEAREFKKTHQPVYINSYGRWRKAIITHVAQGSPEDDNPDVYYKVAYRGFRIEEEVGALADFHKTNQTQNEESP